MENQTNKNIKAIIISIIVAVVAVVAIALGANIITRAETDGWDPGETLGGTKLMLTDHKVVGGLVPDYKSDNNSWPIQNWSVETHGFTRSPSFRIQTYKEPVPGRHFHIEDVYHSFVTSNRQCNLSAEGYYQSINSDVAVNRPWQWGLKEFHMIRDWLYTADIPSLEYMSPRDNGSCVVLRVRMVGSSSITIYASYYVRHSPVINPNNDY